MSGMNGCACDCDGGGLGHNFSFFDVDLPFLGDPDPGQPMVQSDLNESVDAVHQSGIPIGNAGLGWNWRRGSGPYRNTGLGDFSFLDAPADGGLGPTGPYTGAPPYQGGYDLPTPITGCDPSIDLFCPGTGGGGVTPVPVGDGGGGGSSPGGGGTDWSKVIGQIIGTAGQVASRAVSNPYSGPASYPPGGYYSYGARGGTLGGTPVSGQIFGSQVGISNTTLIIGALVVIAFMSGKR